ncbi:MAG: hypothetical protein ACPGO5_02840 [Patescibacteria group bacterium]
MRKTPDNQNGLALLVVVIIIAFTALTYSLGTSLLGIAALEHGVRSDAAAEVHGYTESCIEEGLGRLRTDNSYSGGSLSIGSGSCILSVTGAGSTRTLVATGTIDIFSRVLEVDVTLGASTITVDSWNVQ